MRQLARELNRHCACITLDRKALDKNIQQQLHDPEAQVSASPAWQKMFADSAVFVPEHDVEQMRAAVCALEAAIALPGYQRDALSWAPASAMANPGAVGVFMGYDFHLAEEGPKLIEVNSNAGGAFLNAKLAHAQCCSGANDSALIEQFDVAVMSMFEREWQAQGRAGAIGRVAIVDDEPQQQYLYPEFLLTRNLFRDRGIDAVICAPSELTCDGTTLTCNGLTIDLVYNRLVDFGLDKPQNLALRQAWLQDAAVITPTPAPTRFTPTSVILHCCPRSSACWSGA